MLDHLNTSSEACDQKLGAAHNMEGTVLGVGSDASRPVIGVVVLAGLLVLALGLFGPRRRRRVQGGSELNLRERPAPRPGPNGF